MAQARRKGEVTKRLKNTIRALLNLSLLVLIIGGLFYGWQWLITPGNFPVERVKILSNYQYLKPEEAQGIVTPYLEQGFFSFDVNGLRQALLESPWVRQAFVKRVWPGEIHISLVEQQPVAKWGEGALINTQGELFTPNPWIPIEPIPTLSGTDGQVAEVLHYYRDLSEQLRPLQLTIETLTISPRGSLEMVLTNGMTVLLGREEIPERLQRFIQFYLRFVTNQPPLKTMDMRYNNGFAVSS